MAGKRRQEWGRERGAVLLLVTFSLIAFFGFAALTLDIGRMYIVKSQLQNAADAAALRAARALNGTVAALATAENEGVEAALRNRNLLATTALAGTDVTLEFATEPFPGNWATADAACQNDATECFFARAITRKSGIASFLAGVLGIDANAAAASAVAGRLTVDISPLAICPLERNDCPPTNPTGTCGYKRGATYSIGDVNKWLAFKGIGSGVYYFVDPVATQAGTCVTTNTDDFRPYVCVGKITAAVAAASTVYTNSGNTGGAVWESLDSRFDQYAPQGQCNPATAPPDRNVMQFTCARGTGKCDGNPRSPRKEIDWTTPGATDDPATTGPGYMQGSPEPNPSAPLPPCMSGPPGSITECKKPIVWSATRPDAAGAAITGVSANGQYPATGTPYSQTSGPYFAAPSNPLDPDPLRQNRRMLNLIIVDCSTAGGNCRPVNKLAIGQFFMTRRSASPDDPSGPDVEFVRMVSFRDILPEIKLFE